MSARLQDVIRYLVYNAKYPPTKTSLIKLVYMADYYHWKLYGEQLTDCRYSLQRYGAACFDIPNVASRMGGKELKITPILYPNAYQIMYERGPESDSRVDLTLEQREVLDIVISRHSVQCLPELKKAHYETEPMRKVKHRGEILDMNLIGSSHRVKNSLRIRELQAHIKKVRTTTSGSPEERAKHYVAMTSSLSHTRQRANTVRLRG